MTDGRKKLEYIDGRGHPLGDEKSAIMRGLVDDGEATLGHASAFDPRL